MSAESVPVLSGAIRSFEMLMTQWERLRTKYPELAPWVDIGLKWAKKYYDRMDDTDAYVIAMCEFLPNSLFNLNNRFIAVLNPCLRFEWITCHWEEDRIKHAKTLIIDTVSTLL